MINDSIQEILFIDFPFEHLKELLYLMQLNTRTGDISSEKEGVLYKYSEEPIHVTLE